MADDLSVFSAGMANLSGQQLASGDAMIRIFIEVERFNADVDAYISTFRKEAEKEIKALTLELLARIQRRTPVDTGRLKNSFHIIAPGETDHYTYQDHRGRSYWGALDGETHAQDDDEQIEGIVGTNVPYAIYIEAGHSRQAPNGMVAISYAEMASALETAIERALEDRTR